MDNVPFTLFFMVCLLSLKRNVMGKPATDADMKAVPKTCQEQLLNQNYCNIRPLDYPTDDKLIQLYNENIGNFNFRPQINETGNRDDEKEHICIQKTYLADHVYVIRTKDHEIRYVFYLPQVYELVIPVTKCGKGANKMLDNIYKKKKIGCKQNFFQYPYIALSRDMNSLEPVKILGLESSCDPVLKYK